MKEVISVNINGSKASDRKMLSDIIEVFGSEITKVVLCSGDRNDNQLPYYWGVVVDSISQETGHEKDEVHEFLLTQFSKHLCNDDTYRVKRTSEMTRREFHDYITKCEVWAGTFLSIVFETKVTKTNL